MPELPEVETITRELRLTAVGKVFEFVKIKNRGSIKSDIDYFQTIKGQSIVDVQRRGKFIVMEISGGGRLVVHLRMTGRLLWEVEPHKKKYIRVVFGFTDGDSLFFSDVRKFGCIWFYKKNAYEQGTGIWKLGKEPLEMNEGELHSLAGKASGSLKAFLLRQDAMTGIGNIYADEICFRSGLNPERKMQSLSIKDINRLYKSVGICLKEGILNCGVSMSDFTGTNGNLGRHQHYLKVYGRDGDPCYECSNPIFKMRTAGRGTFYCGKCQK